MILMVYYRVLSDFRGCFLLCYFRYFVCSFVLVCYMVWTLFVLLGLVFCSLWTSWFGVCYDVWDYFDLIFARWLVAMMMLALPGFALLWCCD